MTQVNILIKTFQTGEIKIVGKLLFLLGVGSLSFSSTCLLGFEDFCTQHAGAILSILVASLILILAGEAMIAFSDHLNPGAVRGRPFLRWMAEPLNKRKQNLNRKCSFCGICFSLPPLSGSRGEAREGSFDRMISGVCLGCGKVVCPRCASSKGLEAKARSFYCPSCGSLVL